MSCDRRGSNVSSARSQRPRTPGSLSELTTNWVNVGSTMFRQTARTHPNPISLNRRLCEPSRALARATASTLNPKVEGSNPSRPIRPERIRDPKRQSAQAARELPKANSTRRIPRSPPVPEREGPLNRGELCDSWHTGCRLGQHEVNNSLAKTLRRPRAPNAPSCRRATPSMVRRGSTVRVRQRAFKKSLQIGVFVVCPDAEYQSRGYETGTFRTSGHSRALAGLTRPRRPSLSLERRSSASRGQVPDCRPVTPEVAGSSPVAPVQNHPANCICCLAGRKRLPVST